MDPDVAELVRAERLIDAARLAEERADHSTASLLYERGCAWALAAAAALRAEDPGRALELAVYADDEATAQDALLRVAARVPLAEAVAARLEARGQPAWAARVLEGAGRALEAARAWERAGDARRAAALFEAAGQPAGAARALEGALRRQPNAWAAAVDLGALLARFGRWEAGARALQRVPAGVPERRRALESLVPTLGHLGLSHAASEAARELQLLGAPSASSDTSAPGAPNRGDAPVARLFGRYERVRQVASSSSAKVLECLDVVRGERVAVKIFAGWESRGGGRDALARFEREANAMRSVAHPNVVPLVDVIADGPALVLAWMPGGTLEDLLRAGPLPPARAVEVATAVLSALGEAHRLGILHRDVKPANILFDEAGAAHLSDFGVAHLGDVSTTATAAVFGTLAYMSPEQRSGRPATIRSDLFAVGVALREAITGERPAPTATLRRPSDAHQELDARHDALVASLTAEDPAARPADAFEARVRLTALPWPAAVDPTRTRPRSISDRVAPRTDRVDVLPDGTVIDAWTGRAVETVPLTERVLARARAFAVAGHPALQSVWRVDEASQTVWLEALPEAPLDRPLTATERARLAEALAALHVAGGVHGQVDARHLALSTDGVVLRFEPGHDPTATADRDHIALTRL